MNPALSVPVTVRWYTPEEGGRRSGPPPGPIYTPTGRFEQQSLEEECSVILNIIPNAERATYHVSGVLSPGFPENVPDFAERFTRGERFILHEGRRPVAVCVLTVPAPAAAGS